LTRRFRERCENWQFIVWGRQALLHVISAILEVVRVYADKETVFFYVANIFGSLVLVLLCVFFVHHVRRRPFEFPVCIYLESAGFLFSILFLLLGLVYGGVDHAAMVYEANTGIDQTSNRYALEAMLLSIIVLALLMGISYFALDYYRVHRAMKNFEIMYTEADKALDEPLIDMLKNDTVRLIKCSWLIAREDLPDDSHRQRHGCEDRTRCCTARCALGSQPPVLCRTGTSPTPSCHTTRS